MKIENQKVNDCRVKLVISAGPEETAEDYGKVTRLYTQRARIPGFRPGKAPLACAGRLQFGRASRKTQAFSVCRSARVGRAASVCRAARKTQASSV